MGIALFSFSGLVAALQSLVGWCMGAAPARASRGRRSAPVPRPKGLNPEAGRGHIAWAAARQRPGHAMGRPLRVLRVVEACHAPASAGRMVISGRMADVCAELERLAELEAAVQ